MAKITILGSGTTNLVPERNAASVLVQRGDKNFVYDFGRGTALQLIKLGLKQDDIQTIILSHYHPDHVSDLLPYLHAASWSQIDRRTKPLIIYGPPNVAEFMSSFMRPFSESDLSNGYEVTLTNLSIGEMVIQDCKFSFTDLRHSYGMSFKENDKVCAIMADSDDHDSLVSALAGVELGLFSAGQMSDEAIVELAISTQAKKLVCSHLYRDLDENALNQAANQKGFEGRVIVATDLMEFEI